MGLLNTQQERFVVFLGNTLEENKGLFFLSLSSLSGKDAPQPLVNIHLEWVLTKTKGCFQQDGGYSNSKVGLGSALGLSPNGIENFERM